MGSPPRTAVPARSLLQHGLSTRCSFLQGTATCCGIGSSTVCRVDICSTEVLHGLQGDNLLHHGLLHGLQGNLCSSAWSTSSSFFTGLGVCRAVSHLLTAAAQHFLPLLKYVITGVPPALLMGSALASSRSVLELAGTDSVRHEAAHRRHPCSFPAPTKTLPCKPSELEDK